MTEPDNELRRFDTVPLELVATLTGTRCYSHDDCDLSRDHDTNCAVVSPVGLVHEVLPDRRSIAHDEIAALRKIVSAFNEVEDAARELESLIHDIDRNGPERVKKLLGKRFRYVDIEWPIPLEEKEWQRELDEF